MRSEWSRTPLVVELSACLIPNHTSGAGPVHFLDDDVICTVEELVLRRAARLGWWVLRGVAGFACEAEVVCCSLAGMVCTVRAACSAHCLG